MPSLRSNVPRQLRARADETRAKAAAAPDEPTRKRLLQDAENWERMAAYEEKNPQPPLVPPYYPPGDSGTR